MTSQPEQNAQPVVAQVSSVPEAVINPQAVAPVATPGPVLWGTQLSTPDFTNASKDDVVSAYNALLAQFNDIQQRHSTLLSLAQNKDWGFVNDERKNQLEAAMTQIGAILLNASPTQAVLVAGQIVGIIQQVMPGVLPNPSGTPLQT